MLKNGDIVAVTIWNEGKTETWTLALMEKHKWGAEGLTTCFLSPDKKGYVRDVASSIFTWGGKADEVLEGKIKSDDLSTIIALLEAEEKKDKSGNNVIANLKQKGEKC